MDPRIATSRDAGALRLTLEGEWTTAHLTALESLVRGVLPAGLATAAIDATRMERIDLSGAWLLGLLEQRLQQAGASVDWQGERPSMLEFVEHSGEGMDAPPPPQPILLNVVAAPLGLLGRGAVGTAMQSLGALDFLGRTVTTFARAAGTARRLRLPSVVRHVFETGLSTVPIVALIAFLISVIVAYIGAQQLRQFGGEIYVADLVTVSVLRELGVLLTAIIVAGRSGSAFAAELGVMQLNDEVDALRALGMDPFEVLVLPRVLGLMIALPLLTIIADGMGLAGGALLSWYLVDVPFGQFVARMDEAIAPWTFWVGIIKAPVFAAVIAMIGCYRGMQVRGSSRELGRLTTEAVVESIFLVILVDAMFAILFLELDI